jgi:hypothetical protein
VLPASGTDMWVPGFFSIKTDDYPMCDGESLHWGAIIGDDRLKQEMIERDHLHARHPHARDVQPAIAA